MSDDILDEFDAVDDDTEIRHTYEIAERVIVPSPPFPEVYSCCSCNFHNKARTVCMGCGEDLVQQRAALIEKARKRMNIISNKRNEAIPATRVEAGINSQLECEITDGNPNNLVRGSKFAVPIRVVQSAPVDQVNLTLPPFPLNYVCARCNTDNAYRKICRSVLCTLVNTQHTTHSTSRQHNITPRIACNTAQLP